MLSCSLFPCLQSTSHRLTPLSEGYCNFYSYFIEKKNKARKLSILPKVKQIVNIRATLILSTFPVFGGAREGVVHVQ